MSGALLLVTKGYASAAAVALITDGRIGRLDFPTYPIDILEFVLDICKELSFCP